MCSADEKTIEATDIVDYSIKHQGMIDKIAKGMSIR
jgi:hypothetical protein